MKSLLCLAWKAYKDRMETNPLVQNQSTKPFVSCELDRERLIDQVAINGMSSQAPGRSGAEFSAMATGAKYNLIAP